MEKPGKEYRDGGDQFRCAAVETSFTMATTVIGGLYRVMRHDGDELALKCLLLCARMPEPRNRGVSAPSTLTRGYYSARGVIWRPMPGVSSTW